MSGDVHVRFCESLGVRFPGATHPTLPEGAELRIVSARLPWRESPDPTELFYTVEVKGSRYKVRAAALDGAV